MARTGLRRTAAALGAAGTVAATGAAWAQTTTPAAAGTPSLGFVYLIIAFVIIGSLIVLLLIRAAVAKSKFSLGDALSEEVTITAMTTNAAGVQVPLLTAAGATQTVTELRASISRLIALMGLMVIMLMFLGFGALALYHFGMTGEMPKGVNDVVKFLTAGLTLFAPYLVNKFASVFDSLGKP